MTTNWILVADAGRAQLYAANAGLRKLEKLREFSDSRLEESRRGDKRGSTFDRAGEGRHLMEPPTSDHQKASQGFAKELAAELKRGHNDRRYERLVLIAAPAFLGDLRGELDRQVAKSVHKTLDKDLTEAGPEEIERQLANV